MASESVPVAIVGAGHAGVSLSYELKKAGVEHVILERSRVAQSWRDRWDSFCLVTPNWTMRLPGHPYDGADPDGYMPKAEIVTRLETYAKSFGAPVREGVDVTAIERTSGGFSLRTSDGVLRTSALVMATGAYPKPHRPPAAADLPADLFAIDSGRYTNPGSLPAGDVLIIGSGQTGCQIADELNQHGRRVTLACGRAPWAPRRVAGRDIVSWIAETPFFDHTVTDLPHPSARLISNVQATGHHGGQDLHYRTLNDSGVVLTGRLAGFEDRYAWFADDLRASVDFGDARYNEISNLIRKTCAERGEPPPEFPEPAPFDADPPDRLDLSSCGAIIFTSGYRPDYSQWLPFPGAFDDYGFPLQKDGESSVVPGLFFIGTHFLRKRKSGIFLGIEEDAAIVAGRITGSLPR
jgi:putative flavoprotein involved in K+ transport